MTIGISALINAVTTHASASGFFDTVQGHEPKSAPGNGLTYAVFLSGIGPARTASGLDATSARVELTGRIYKPFLSQPEDLIDPLIADSVDALMAAYAGDFELGGNARNVDLRGAQGAPLGGRAGYQTIDKTPFRVFDIIIPIIVNDAWSEVA
jgi:hypothetical protein